MLDKLFANLLSKKETVYKGTANPNATNSELDAKRIIKRTPFIDLIESRGYKYDSGNDWWARTWTTESEPKSSIEEVYQRLENGKWKQVMIGYVDRVFYEEDVK